MDPAPNGLVPPPTRLANAKTAQEDRTAPLGLSRTLYRLPRPSPDGAQPQPTVGSRGEVVSGRPPTSSLTCTHASGRDTTARRVLSLHNPNRL